MSFAIMCMLASAQLAADCVDGVTPDCSDAAACAPSEGDAAIIVDAANDSEASVIEPPSSDAGRDAEAGDAAEGG